MLRTLTLLSRQRESCKSKHDMNELSSSCGAQVDAARLRCGVCLFLRLRAPPSFSEFPFLRRIPSLESRRRVADQSIVKSLNRGSASSQSGEPARPTRLFIGQTQRAARGRDVAFIAPACQGVHPEGVAGLKNGGQHVQAVVLRQTDIAAGVKRFQCRGCGSHPVWCAGKPRIQTVQVGAFSSESHHREESQRQTRADDRPPGLSTCSITWTSDKAYPLGKTADIFRNARKKHRGSLGRASAPRRACPIRGRINPDAARPVAP